MKELYFIFLFCNKYLNLYNYIKRIFIITIRVDQYITAY